MVDALTRRDLHDVGVTLARLQDLDCEIMRLRKRLDDMPEMHAVIQVRAKKRQVESLKVKSETLVSRLEREVARIDDECSGLTAKIDAEQHKIMSGEVANPKELFNITREMDALKRRREKLEMEQVTLMDRADKAKQQFEQVYSALQKLEVREEKLIEVFKKVGGDFQVDIEKQLHERSKIVAKLPEEFVARYESLKETKDDFAVGQLQEGTCTACRIALPADSVRELLSGPAVGDCPACRRMLVMIDAGETVG